MSKLWNRAIWSVLVAALFFAVAAQAAQTAPKKAAATKAPAVHEISSSGVITSVDATHLMMTRKVNGKEQPITLVLTPETKREGTLAAGNKVSVHYHMENNDQVATLVRAQAGTPKAKKS